MGLVYSSVIDAPIYEVFDWHTRPGAITRLSPPWQPVRVVAEADSLQNGRAELGLPGGLRWVADHQPDGYDPPRRFVDSIGSEGLASLPARLAVRWRHTHEFAELGGERTRVTDRVDTAVPARALRAMFAYRHRQLADDIAAHRLAAARGLTPITVAVTGSSGLVGSALSAFLSTGGHRVIHLVRRTASKPDERQWNPDGPDSDLLNGVDAVIHLAGASIAGRFTASHRSAIRDSRIGPTRRLAELMAKSADGPKVLICASAIGYYGYDRGDQTLTEDSERGDGFLADVVDDWERAATAAEGGSVRVVRVRTGIVQSPSGGTLRLLLPLFRAGLGGRVGDGQQWFSYIGIDDLVDVYHRGLWDTALAGPVNAVAVDPVRNSDYTSALAKVLRRPAVLPVPALGPRLLLGEQGARELACANQRVLPTRLQQTGHRFRHPALEQTLRHLLGR
ncbi:TIGR01777 family oxidoreductase [Mycobacterium sp.]|uniref:TIGR01777 family oxidoreductase n=1 Tax=Mycobacterium sp. TaxID=1785 RepID=UPI003C76C5CC